MLRTVTVPHSEHIYSEVIGFLLSLKTNMPTGTQIHHYNKMHVGLHLHIQYNAEASRLRPISAVDNPQICQEARLYICCLHSVYIFLPVCISR